MDTDFSDDGKYLAHLTEDGKLKIWNTDSNTLEQEFTPDYHLTTPCTCLKFLGTDKRTSSDPSESAQPKKKKKPNLKSPDILLGTNSGYLLSYSISESKLKFTIDNNISQQINCLTVEQNNNIVYTGSDTNIIEWNLQKKLVISKWKAGNEKVSAILSLPHNRLITASKSIKIWNLRHKKVCQTFTGHSSEIICLKHVPNLSYILSASREDRLLNCWNISNETNDKNAVVSFIMDDTIRNIALNISPQGHINLAATIKTGGTHIYQHMLNGRCTKPIKPKTTIQVVTDAKETKLIMPIHIFGSTFRDENTICIGHGTSILLTFENIVINLTEKLQCLIRNDPLAIITSNTASVSKMKTPVIGEHVTYLTPNVTSNKKRRLGQDRPEVPMEQRLENLKLNQLETPSGVPRGNNVAQLLLQGLHSKDKSILHTVLSKRDEEVIKNSLLRLPLQVIPALVHELADLLKGKTLSSQIGVLWLKCLVQTHTSILLSNPDLIDLLQPVLSSLNNRISLQMPLNKFKGRLNLLLRGVNDTNKTGTPNNTVENEPLLVYIDNDSADSKSDEMVYNDEESSHSDDENMECDDKIDFEDGDDDDSESEQSDEDSDDEEEKQVAEGKEESSDEEEIVDDEEMGTADSDDEI